ncbi:hypothetical protein IWY39_000174 [Sphingobium sp. JAI105]|nr:hypothetical protein [Sphingobium sp. JAI105]
MTPGTLCEREDIAAIQSAMRPEVDIFDTGVDKAQFRAGKTISQPSIGASGDLAVQHEPEPFVSGQIASGVLLGNVAPRGRHAR